MHTSTHTFAKLLISKPAFDEISAKLKAAGYDHAFLVDGVIPLIDMHGIAVTPDLSPECLPSNQSRQSPTSPESDASPSSASSESAPSEPTVG